MDRPNVRTPASECCRCRARQQERQDRLVCLVAGRRLSPCSDGIGNLTANRNQLSEGGLPRNIAANCQEMENRSPRSLLEPDVWTGTANTDALEPLREKRAEIHRGSRRRYFGPPQEAGYTSAIVIADPYPKRMLQSGGVHIRPHRTAPFLRLNQRRKLGFHRLRQRVFALVFGFFVVRVICAVPGQGFCRLCEPSRRAGSFR